MLGINNSEQQWGGSAKKKLTNVEAQILSKNTIEPRILKGFRDHLPERMIPRQSMIRTLERVFSSFGFVPIDTPALEYTEILLGKGSEETDKQLYRFEDNGGRDVALRFDLTVPLARFAATHIGKLGTPFKRYHIAPVWRAEKPQRGRFREFYQCDFDILGSTSVNADAEIVGVIHHALQALEIPHKIRLNNRSILNGLLETIEAEEQSTAVLRAIDKLDKLGEETVRSELQEQAELDDGSVTKVFSFLELSRESVDGKELLSKLRALLADSERALSGIEQLETLLSLARSHGLSAENIEVDLSIARGLDYYTGTVFETVCTDLPEMGSICSGGRYDDLASLYTKQHIPGVGASVGLDRALAILEELERTGNRQTLSDALLTVSDEKLYGEMVHLATSLRGAGFRVEMLPEVKKLGAQMKYADRKGIPYVIIVHEEDLRSAVCSLKNMKSGEQIDQLPFTQLPEKLQFSGA